MRAAPEVTEGNISECRGRPKSLLQMETERLEELLQGTFCVLDPEMSEIWSERFAKRRTSRLIRISSLAGWLDLSRQNQWHARTDESCFSAGVAYVAFETKEDLEKALELDKCFMERRQLHVLRHVDRNKRTQEKPVSAFKDKEVAPEVIADVSVPTILSSSLIQRIDPSQNFVQKRALKSQK